MKKSLSFVVVLMLLLSLTIGVAQAAYPEKPIELIVPFAAGGGTDSVGRAIAEALKVQLGQDVVVSNKTGGGGAVGMQGGLSARADGYTITMVTREVVSLPLLGQAPFKTEDFHYIGLVNIDPTVVVVSTDSPYETIEDLMAALEEKPGELIFSASVVPNYYGATVSLVTGLTFTTVPFDGAAPAITELLGGRSDFGLYGPGEIKAQMDAGNLRPLAVMAEERFAGLPDVPTFKEKGIELYSGTYRGIAVSPDTPEEVIIALEAALEEACKDEKFVSFMDSGFFGISYKNGADFKAYVEDDMNILGDVIETLK